MGPVSEDVHSFVILEYVFVFVDIGRLHGIKVSDDVSSLFSLINSRGVESVIVRGSEVDNHIEEFVSAVKDSLNKGGDSLVVFISDSEHKLIESV